MNATLSTPWQRESYAVRGRIDRQDRAMFCAVCLIDEQKIDILTEQLSIESTFGKLALWRSIPLENG